MLTATIPRFSQSSRREQLSAPKAVWKSAVRAYDPLMGHGSKTQSVTTPLSHIAIADLFQYCRKRSDTRNALIKILSANSFRTVQLIVAYVEDWAACLCAVKASRRSPRPRRTERCKRGNSGPRFRRQIGFQAVDSLVDGTRNTALLGRGGQHHQEFPFARQADSASCHRTHHHPDAHHCREAPPIMSIHFGRFIGSTLPVNTPPPLLRYPGGDSLTTKRRSKHSWQARRRRDETSPPPRKLEKQAGLRVFGEGTGRPFPFNRSRSTTRARTRAKKRVGAKSAPSRRQSYRFLTRVCQPNHPVLTVGAATT